MDIILPKGAEVKEDNKPEELVIPIVKDPTFVYKKDSRMFAVIIPANKIDAFTACCVLDSMKMIYLDVVKSIMAEEMEKKSKIVKPGMAQSMKEFILKKG